MGLDHYSADQPLVLLTTYHPDSAGGGAVILQSLLQDRDRSRILFTTLTPAPIGAPLGTNAILLSGGEPALRRSLLLDSTWHARTMAERLLSLARQHRARGFWVVMHGAAVAIAARLARAGVLPLHLTVHDDPPYGVALRSRRHLFLVPLVARDFIYALKRARSIDVVSEGMARRYKEHYGVDSVVVHRGLAAPVAEIPRYDRMRNGLSVGILGNVYGYAQLPILARAVTQAAQRLNVPGRVVVVGQGFGDRLQAELSNMPHLVVEVTGHLDESAAVRRLQDCFALYLNYPFSFRDCVFRTTSFPTKLTTYLMAARPILIHAPADSTVRLLAGPDDYALPWETLVESDAVELLEHLWRMPGSDRSFHTEADRVRLRYFDLDRNRRTLLQALASLASPLPR